MTSATLFREGTDLDALLAELDGEHPGQVRVVEVSHQREGGVFGFFARPRVAVHYTLADTGNAATDGDGAGAATGIATAMATAAGRDGATAGNPVAARPHRTSDELLATDGDGGDPLAALIAAAEMVETGQPPAATGGAADGGTDTANNVEFARMLLDIAAQKAAERGLDLPAAERGGILPAAAGGAPDARPGGPGRRGGDAPRGARTTGADRAVGQPADRPNAPTPNATAPPVPADPIAATGPANPTKPAGPSEADERLTLRRRLSELGVPIARIPADATHRYAAVEHLVGQLPEPAPLPAGGPAVVVLAAPAATLARTLPALAHRLGVPADSAWTFRAARGVGRDDRRLIEVGDAKALAAATRRPGAAASVPTLVAVGLDEDRDAGAADATGAADGPDAPGGPTAAEIVAALGPDALWLHVDATRKPADTANAVRALGTPSALVVTGAARTTSPASVWQLDVPIALLDGRAATRSAWAVLLLDKLAEADH